MCIGLRLNSVPLVFSFEYCTFRKFLNCVRYSDRYNFPASLTNEISPTPLFLSEVSQCYNRLRPDHHVHSPTGNVEKMSLDKKKDYPLIFPDGKMMKPEEADLIEDQDETIFNHMTRTCLNEAPIDTDFSDINASDPEEIVRSMLEDLLAELRQKNTREISYYEALTMSYEAKIQNIFKNTYLLRYLDLTKLKHKEHSTCFFVNLANLMWIHAIFSFGEEFHNGLHYKNWCLRQIIFNMVGYRVGDIEFISLFDLQSRLFNYPTMFRTNVLDSFDILEDPRIHCALCQPYVFSPKLTVLVPNTYNEDLTDLQNEYIRNYIIVDSHIDLLIPVPLMMLVERSSFIQESESECIENADGIPEKFALLIQVLEERGFPYYELLSKDVHIINDTHFTIKLEYHMFDVETLSTIRKVVWKCCRFHKSLYHCLQHQASLVRSTFQDDHLSINSMCRCKDKTVVCLNNILYKMNEMYYPMLNEYKVDIDFDNNGLRCLYAAISFAIGIRKKKERFILGANTDNEFLLMLKIVESLYISVPTSHICDKIKACVKIYLLRNEAYERWPQWYNIFIEDPNEVLNFIVDHKNHTLADEWMLVNYTLEPGYTFTLQAFAKYLSFLSDLEDREPLRKALGLLRDLSYIGEMCIYVMKNFFSPNRLINLISTVIDSNIFNNTDKIKFYALLAGLRMIIIIPAYEQSFYFDIASHPLLIIEQLILNKKINLLKTVLEEVIEFMSSLPYDVQKMELITRDEIDEILRDYATKALHFRKKPAAADCINAALLHAEIFKEGNFHPPDEVPSSKKWIPNNWVSKCMCCNKVEFSVFVRRHHCRRCGRVVCDPCSSKKMKVATYRGVVRVCDQCFDFEAQYENMDDSISDNSTATDDSGKKPVYKLTPDADMNVVIRQQAGFDSAPDIELCLSILELHSESIAVPRTLYTNAESLIKILRQRIVCPANFDYNEITNIARSLLLAAKIYYTHLGETHGIRRCEELTSELDIITQLASLKLFPSEGPKPIRDMKELRKIRDTVLERQQWELALEISTKIGLECNSIWYLWGKTLLKSGDYAAARDKISRSNVKKNPAMLNDIIDIIYSIAERETPRSFAGFFKLNSAKGTAAIPDHLMEECLHYISNYGMPQQQFEFYAKHDRLTDVMKVVMEKKISPKQFVDKVFAPYMKSNDYATVLRSMKILDPSLEKWQEYINEISVFCKRNKLFNELYDIQLWAKDYFRAAISSTLFYTKDAITYGQLLKREEHLVNAISHMKAFLDQAQESKKAPIVKQLTCLNMQMEVTKMISCNSTCSNTKFVRVPTLLGTESDKCSVICLLFDSQKDFKTAFNYTERIIAEFSLNVSKVYKKLTEHFMEKDQPQSAVTLIACILELKLDRKEVIDDIACVAITLKADADLFLKYITDMSKKIEMCIVSGRLKSAYTISVRANKLEFIERITEECEKANMTGLLNICRKKVAEIKSS